MEPTKEEIQAQMQEFERAWVKDQRPEKELEFPPALERIWQLQEEQKMEQLHLAERQRRQFSALFGPYVSGDYSIGDKIRVRLRPQPPEDEFEGEVLWSYGPGNTPVSGQHHPLTYVVDAGRGMPVLVHPTEIVQAQE